MSLMTGRTLKLLCFCFIIISASSAQAKNHFVNPSFSATKKSVGSESAPWRNLQNLFTDKKIQAGDKVVLSSGYYGKLVLSQKKYNEKVTIEVKEGHTAKFANVQIWGSKNIHLKGLTVSPSFLRKFSKGFIVQIGKGAEDIRIEAFKIFSAEAIDGWTKETWNEKAASGILASGNRIDVVNSVVRNVDFGISMSATNSRIVGNLVENFSGDGLRGNGDYSLFEGNTVRNCYSVNDNHADGFQSWSTGDDGRVGTGQVTGVTLRRNRIINFEDPNQPFKCQMQGIGLFDGFYVDWKIENNIVITDHYHGITVLGAKNVRIVNNTVVDPIYGKPGPAWIMIEKHKDGRQPEGNLVANNLSTRYVLSRLGVLQLKNLVVRDEGGMFENFEAGDLRLREGSRAIDAGMEGLGVEEDFYGNKRPAGKSIDIGAIERQ